MKSLLSFIHICILLSTIELTQQQRRSSKSTTSKVSSTDVVLEFDESDISNLNLKVKWRLNTSASQTAFNPTKFVLLLEQKRLNFTTFSYEYATPQLLDDGLFEILAFNLFEFIKFTHFYLKKLL